VKIWRFNSVFNRKSFVFAAAIALCLGGGRAVTTADVKTDTASENRISITADQLVVDRDANTAEFLKNVTVTRADGRLTADRVLIYYRDTAGAEGEGNSAGAIKSGIDKMIAEGHVRIETSELTAEAERAVYSHPKQTIVLTGPKTRLRSGNNSVAGSSITLYIDKERIVVVGDAKTRVEAVLTPERPDSAGGK
jgi:lipopolysaccharide export system protein LptA